MNKPIVTVTPKGITEVLVHGPAALRDWRESLRVPVDGAKYTPQFRSGVWDGTWAPGKYCREGADRVWELRCSRGLIGRLGETFELRQATVADQLDAGAVEKVVASRLNGSTLRDYQQEAIGRGLSQRWGRVALATNAGKGAVIALVATVLREARSVRTLVLCDEVAVFQALTEEIERWGGDAPTLLEQGVKEPPSGAVVVAMIPTLARRIKDAPKVWSPWVASFGCVLLDEADKATAETWKRVLRAATNSEWRLGFSGTFPEDRHGDLLMDELMGPILVQAKNMELVERGVSARPGVTLHGFDCTPALLASPVPAKEWWAMGAPDKRRSVYERGIVYSQERHDFVAGLIRPETPTCVIVNRIDHGAGLEATLPGSVFLDGSASKRQRAETLDLFREGKIQVLIVTKILDRGTNKLGSAADLIFVSGEGSSRQTLQRIGRGLRRTDGKEFLRLVDVVDRGHKYLATAGRKRLELYASEGFEVQVVP